jgi:hypothetical protein
VIRLLGALFLLGTLAACPQQPEPVDDDDGTLPVADDDDSSTDDDDSSTDDDDAPPPDPCPEPAPACEGICALYDAECTPQGWSCSAPGMETVELTCDGFDNDCDGEVDEGDVCPDCAFDPLRIDPELYAIWDVDFDFDCNTYLTTLVSGPDWTVMVPEDATQPATTWYGNANQNMGYALVDPDPSNRRVVVTYSCCASCGCQAQNGLTLLYTCQPADPGCGCAGQTNCPGFLESAFLPSGYEDTSMSFNGTLITTPNSLAVGPRNTYYVGNYRPATCSDEAGCVACDPANPNVFCDLAQPNCCDSAAAGRLVQFTLPTATAGASWRVAAIFEGELILGLATGRDSSVLIGTDQGNVYRWDPVASTSTLLQTYAGAVFSITQHRTQGDWYLEVRADPKIVRLSEAGVPMALPAGVPANPAEEGVLQWGPDGQLYRLIGHADSASTLTPYPLP